MSLLEFYKEKNKDSKWFNDHFSSAKKRGGKMFEYVTTNFRTQNSFIDQFKTFLEVENKPRSQWPKQKNHSQEVHKQKVINMIQSKLFKRDINELYIRTEKGALYSDFIEIKISNQEKWFINYIFLLNGYYFNRKNYIVNRTEDLLNYLLSVDGVIEDLIIKEAQKILKLEKKSFSEIIRNDFFYMHSFYNDSDFLIKYLRSSLAEKEELARYIEDNLKNKDYKCCISRKYKPSGVFNREMLLDEIKVFLLTFLFIKVENKNLNNAYNIIVDIFNKNIYSFDKILVFNYLQNNKDVFDPIFEEIMELEDELIDSNYELIEKLETIEEKLVDKPEEYIDETSREGKQKLKTIYSIRKKQAKIEGGYVCALEKINNCEPIYFTAKTNNKNYTELHHLIPREFRNDFPYSIEVLANYVILCPRCHRQIHLAMDRERKHLICALYAERVERLKLVGLELELKKIYEYYQINQ